jgi:hypothetical protein
LQDHDANVRVRPWIEGSIRRSVGVQPTNVTSWSAAERSELSANDDLSIGLNGDGPNVAVRAGIECRVERSVWVQPTDMVSNRRPDASSAERGKEAADENLSIRLQGRARPDSNKAPLRLKPCRPL